MERDSIYDRLSGQEDARPIEIALVVEFRTSGGRVVPYTDEGKLVKVIEDGKERAPKTSDMRPVYEWLLAHGYEPVIFRWLDRAGYIRRRKQVYKRKEA